MMYGALITIVLYYFIFFLYYQKLFPAPKYRWPVTILSLIVINLIYIALGSLEMRWMGIPCILLAITPGLYFSSGMNWMQALYGGAVCVLSAYCARGIFTTILTFFLPIRDTKILFSSDVYFLITIFALPAVGFLFIVFRKTILPDVKLKRFLNHPKQLKVVVVYEIIAAINLTIINQGRYFTPDYRWYLEIVLGCCLLTLGMLIYAIYHSIQMTELMEYEYCNKMLEEQYTHQLNHYKSYQKHTESYRVFRHDFKAMIAPLKTLIRAGKNDEAIQLIDSIYSTMKENVQLHKKYSDNVILDAMMQDLANLCEENKIRLFFSAFTPRKTKLSTLDAIRIFHNVTQNAVEACKKIPAPDRFIEIVSNSEEKWLTLQILNSFDGTILTENGEFVTTKQNGTWHGFGLGIVKEIVENAGGLVMVDANCEEKIFSLRVHLPQSDANDIPS